MVQFLMDWKIVNYGVYCLKCESGGKEGERKVGMEENKRQQVVYETLSALWNCAIIQGGLYLSAEASSTGGHYHDNQQLFL